MKKLICMLGVVATVIAAHASSVNWGYSGDIYNGNSEMASGYAWVVSLGSGTSFDGLSVNTEGQLVLGEGMSEIAGGAVDAGVWNGDVKAISAAANFVLIGYDENTATWGTIGYFAVTPTSTETYVTQDFDFGDPEGIGDWGTMNLVNPATAVPEPTSGLLLLLGVAGLALRRRRA